MCGAVSAWRRTKVRRRQLGNLTAAHFEVWRKRGILGSSEEAPSDLDSHSASDTDTDTDSDLGGQSFLRRRASEVTHQVLTDVRYVALL